MDKYVQKMQEKYKIKGIRRMNDDRNDFYRSIYYSYFEKIISAKAIEKLIEL